MFENFLESKKEEMIKKLQELIQIPSVNSISNNPLMPFGLNINNALKYMLDLGKSLGFKTKNIDGYCGYIEFGEGDELVGIIGHLDVVPEGDNWTFPPFSATIFDGNIYGRGAIDDKGPVIASLYAMKAVMETCRVKKRIRLILGLDEEKDWKCINYYKKHEEIPDIGFSPDADFPCIYAEKAILNNSLKMDLTTISKNPICIKSFDCFNNPINVVPKRCSTVLSINSSKIIMCDLLEHLKTIIRNNNFEIDIYKIDENEVKLTSHGISAHAAHPDLGTNAISQLLVTLDNIFKHYGVIVELLDFFAQYINIQYDGKNLGISFEYESRKINIKCW